MGARWALVLVLGVASAIMPSHLVHPPRPVSFPRAQAVAVAATFAEEIPDSSPAEPERRVRVPVADEYDELRNEYDRSKLIAFFLRKPVALLGRFADFANSYRRLKQIWDSSEMRGVRLREEIARLGPVAVKLGQTLSQRPDIISEVFARRLCVPSMLAPLV